jgi:hypothetical protein
MGMNEPGVGPKALLYADPVDPVSAAGLFMSDIWLEKRIVTIDMLGDEFLEAVNTADPITTHRI